MGVVIDTCVFVAAERRGLNFGELLIQVRRILPGERFVGSSITAAELIQGVYQADAAYARKREVFVRTVVEALEIVPFTKETAWIAGRIRGTLAAAGGMLPVADSLIAATALELGYGIVTNNVKDFIRIPDLHVTPFTLS